METQKHQKECISQFTPLSYADFRSKKITIDTKTIQLLLAQSGFYAEFASISTDSATVLFKDETDKTVCSYTVTSHDLPIGERSTKDVEIKSHLAIKAYMDGVDLYFGDRLLWLQNTLIAVANDIN